jgi:hypothetical protein
MRRTSRTASAGGRSDSSSGSGRTARSLCIEADTTDRRSELAWQVRVPRQFGYDAYPTGSAIERLSRVSVSLSDRYPASAGKQVDRYDQARGEEVLRRPGLWLRP